MHYKLLTLLIGALLIGNAAHAKIFRVGYAGTPVTGVDYATLQAAHDAASAGDTVQIYGTLTGAANITKQLVILGYGYNFDVHAGLQAVGGDAPSDLGTSTINLNEGSDGSILKGVSCFVTIQSNSSTPISNIKFERCYISNMNIANSPTTGLISNIKIIGCVCPFFRANNFNSTSSPVTNLLIQNSILLSCEISNSGSTAIIENCVLPYSVIGYSLNLGDATVIVKNCISYDYHYYTSDNPNTIYMNNFFTVSQPAVLPAGSNNHWGQDWGTIFNRLGGTSNVPGVPGYINNPNTLFDENYYILKSGSPAIGAGIDDFNNTTDCGIFGGNQGNQYIVSGVPPIPSFYKLTASGTDASANPYNITVSVKSNN